MNDYLILFDENNRPYISHASDMGSNNYKYIAKVPLGNGRYRYFYSKESYNAYLKADKRSNKAAQFIKKSAERNPVYKATKTLAKDLKRNESSTEKNIASKEKTLKKKFGAKRVKYVSPGVYDVDGVMYYNPDL